jgi:molybdopterin-guanine dinucleotide biosynthesis protein A
MSRPAVSAAILAGGQARRMGGEDKSRLLVDGRSIIVRQLDVLQHVAQEVFVVASDAARFRDLSLPVHADRLPNLGAIGGLYTAVSVAAAERVLVVACDLPFLNAAVLAELAARSQSADGAWIRSARGIEPLFACYCRRSGAKILAAIHAGRLKVSDLGGELEMIEIDQLELAELGAPDDLLTNINTPADYARVQYRAR